ncbi:MAG: hypothetical protein AAGF55_05255 [Pseudomonadota bacterium]
MTEHHSFLLVQQSLKQKPRKKKQRVAAKEALIDCLLVLAESAEILKLKRTAEYVDMASDMAASEVERQSAAGYWHQTPTSATRANAMPIFKSRRCVA